MDRRSWLKTTAAAGVGLFTFSPTALTSASGATGATVAAGGSRARARLTSRWARGREVRRAAMERAFGQRMPAQVNNGEEADYPYVANYSKCFPHDDVGEVDRGAYQTFLRAIESGRPEDYDRIPLGVAGAARLFQPQGGLAFDHIGPDSHGLTIRPAPRIDGAENSSEAAELYWMALARDVNVARLGDDAVVADAAADLSTYSDFRGPKAGGQVTPGTIFRGGTAGEDVGPYISQFLYRDLQLGVSRVQQRNDTVAPGVDYMTDFAEWLAVQRGTPRTTARNFADTRYIRTIRDLTHYVHFDVDFHPYFGALLILLGLPGRQADVWDGGNPYTRSTNQFGFATLGRSHVGSLLAEAANRVAKHALFQKWQVHRRIRPEGFGGRLDVHLARDPGRYDGIIHAEILESPVLERARSRYGSYLLPMAYPEGCPTNTAYPAGHSLVAAACVTILKAWFNESYVIPDPVVPNDDGTALVPYTGPGAGELTIGGELNKLAGNVGIARCLAGVHWRTDHSESLRLGESVAIGILRDHKDTYNERATFSFTRFDGTPIEV